MTRYKVIKEFIVNSFPSNHTISIGETVVCSGYIFSNMVVELDSEMHKPSYSHLTGVSAVLDDKQLLCLEEIKDNK